MLQLGSADNRGKIDKLDDTPTVGLGQDPDILAKSHYPMERNLLEVVTVHIPVFPLKKRIVLVLDEPLVRSNTRIEILVYLGIDEGKGYIRRPRRPFRG